MRNWRCPQSDDGTRHASVAGPARVTAAKRHGEGSDPDLSEEGLAQVGRLPKALSRFPIARVVSSPQRRAIQTAEPVAAARELAVEIDNRFAEYDRDLRLYIPVEQIREETPKSGLRLAQGRLPSGVDEDSFRARVLRGGRGPVRRRSTPTTRSRCSATAG